MVKNFFRRVWWAIKLYQPAYTFTVLAILVIVSNLIAFVAGTSIETVIKIALSETGCFIIAWFIFVMLSAWLEYPIYYKSVIDTIANADKPINKAT